MHGFALDARLRCQLAMPVAMLQREPIAVRMLASRACLESAGFPITLLRANCRRRELGVLAHARRFTDTFHVSACLPGREKYSSAAARWRWVLQADS